MAFFQDSSLGSLDQELEIYNFGGEGYETLGGLVGGGELEEDLNEFNDETFGLEGDGDTFGGKSKNRMIEEEMTDLKMESTHVGNEIFLSCLF
jgi:hypothetical protein